MKRRVCCANSFVTLIVPIINLNSIYVYEKVYLLILNARRCATFCQHSHGTHVRRQGAGCRA